MTLTQNPAELDPGELHFNAVRAIADGVTPDELRSSTAGTAREAVGKQIADEAEHLASRGVTRRGALRAVKECIRLSVRAVAEAGLRAEGPAVVRTFRRIADTAEREGDTASRDSFLEFAAEAERLLAERSTRSLARSTPAPASAGGIGVAPLTADGPR